MTRRQKSSAPPGEAYICACCGGEFRIPEGVGGDAPERRGGTRRVTRDRCHVGGRSWCIDCARRRFRRQLAWRGDERWAEVDVASPFFRPV